MAVSVGLFVTFFFVNDGFAKKAVVQSFGETLGFDEVILLLEWRRLISLAVVVSMF